MGRAPLALRLVVAVTLLAGCAPGGHAPAFDPDSVPDAYHRPSGALMWPGASRAFLATPGGDLYNGAWRVRLLPFGDGAAAGPPRVIAAEERWLPVLHWTRRAGDLRFAFEAAALGVPRYSNLIVSLAVRVENAGSTPRRAMLRARLEGPDSTPPFFAFDAPLEPSAPIRWAGGGATAPVCGWSEGAAGSGAERAFDWALRPGERRQIRFAFPA